MRTRSAGDEAMEVEEEARRLEAVFAGQPGQLVNFLSGQLSVLKQQAQMLLGLSGLAITVTGFSGHNMVRAGPLSAGSMIAGILSILVATFLALRVIVKLRWVSQDLHDDLWRTAAAVIVRRNAQQRLLAVAGGFVAAGLAGYLLAVVMAALYAGGLLVPPPVP